MISGWEKAGDGAGGRAGGGAGICWAVRGCRATDPAWASPGNWKWRESQMNHQQSPQAFDLKLALGDFRLPSGLQIFNVLLIYVQGILSTTGLEMSFQF